MATSFNSNFNLSIPFSDESVQIHLDQNTDETYIVPGDKSVIYAVYFGYNLSSNVFVSLNAPFAIPAAGNVSTQRFAELNPGFSGGQRYVKGGDILHFITPDASAFVSIALKRLPS